MSLPLCKWLALYFRNSAVAGSSTGLRPDERRDSRRRSLGAGPIGMGGLVQDEILVQQAGVAVRLNPLLPQKWLEQTAQFGKVVKRDTGKIVMLKMVIRPQVGEIPKPARFHQRAPLCGIVGVDIVMLPEAIESERDGKHDKYGHQIQPEGAVPAVEDPECRQQGELKENGRRPFSRNSSAQCGRVARAFPRRGPEIYKKRHGVK